MSLLVIELKKTLRLLYYIKVQNKKKLKSESGGQNKIITFPNSYQLPSYILG